MAYLSLFSSGGVGLRGLLYGSGFSLLHHQARVELLAHGVLSSSKGTVGKRTMVVVVGRGAPETPYLRHWHSPRFGRVIHMEDAIAVSSAADCRLRNCSLALSGSTWVQVTTHWKASTEQYSA